MSSRCARHAPHVPRVHVCHVCHARRSKARNQVRQLMKEALLRSKKAPSISRLPFALNSAHQQTMASRNKKDKDEGKILLEKLDLLLNSVSSAEEDEARLSKLDAKDPGTAQLQKKAKRKSRELNEQIAQMTDVAFEKAFRRAPNLAPNLALANDTLRHAVSTSPSEQNGEASGRLLCP